MNWFRKKESNENEKVKSEYDSYVAPPPFGNYLATAPQKPKSLKNDQIKTQEFKGFTPPPKFEFKENNNYEKYDADFSKYTNSNLYDSTFYGDKPKLFDFNLSHRALSCLESVKLGVKMGTMVGGIFGTLTGVYASIAHKNMFIFPVSVIGGAVSFGFFLGCGMLVRC
ncbi:reactive oxygen species modulator 1, putative [Hepatocystis sp. ex Piliocolobus tephrosceles]|nr:reactive oxygen species modulator 1, putative [Hepatocystis sp. ex Piliocolobus tephrosceles]